MYKYVTELLNDLENWADFPANYFERKNYKIDNFAALIVGVIKYKEEDDYTLISFPDIILNMATNQRFISEIYHISMTVIPSKIIEINDSGEYVCRWIDINENREIIYYDKYSNLKLEKGIDLVHWEQDEKRSKPVSNLDVNIFDDIKSSDIKFYNLEFALSIIFGSVSLYTFFINALMNTFSLFKLNKEELAQVESRLENILQKVQEFKKRKLN